MKFFGFSLGASTVFKEETDGKIITKINGIHSDENLKECFKDFLIKYVFCQECAHTKLTFVENNEKVEGICLFCGKIKIFNGQDKMIRYILRNPTKDKFLKED